MHASPRFHLAFFLAATYPLAASAADADSAADVVVVGQKQPYRSISATGATKTDTLLMDLPQSARVLTADLLQDVGAVKFSDALDLASGIARQSNLGGLWDSYAMRGFTGDPNFGSDFLVNGFNSSRGYNGQRDAANTNTVEILKGPASALYGRGDPGGTVNITTKKPLFQPSQTIEQSIGNYSTYRTAVDLTGPLSETVAYRLNAAYQNGNSFRDTEHSESYVISPSFIWMISPDTTLSYEMEAVQQRTPFDRGVLAVNGRLGLIPNSRFLGEPSDGPITIKSLGHQLFVQHQFNDDWSLQSGLSYRESSLQGLSTEAGKLLADGRTLWRQHRLRDFSATDTSGRLELLGKVATGPVVNNLLFGVDAYRFDDDRVLMRANPTAASPYAIDIYNPVYGQSVPGAMTLNISTKEKQRAHGLYAQDQIDISKQWKALIGVRYDNYTQTFDDRRFLRNTEQSGNATSPRVGIVYQPLKTLSFYASVSKGFRPSSGTTSGGLPFAPESSRSYEIGTKYDAANGKLSSTLAVYKIQKQNVLTVDPLDPSYSVAAGEVESRGVELDVSGEIVRNLRLTAAYAYTDTKITKDNLFKVGSALPDVPKNSANLLLVQDFKLGDGVASFGGGANYVGERSGDVAVSSNFKLPAYTTYKMIASYKPTKKLRVSLNIDNLFNKTYYASSYSQLWVAPGTERTVTLKAQYKF
ncbi:TonB-dependent siderophore receptor [Collimonas fungivorans]|uniref:Ferrichrome-iron receptor n=1 Tax=Collimonas fungivorans (strain Ter331) TaxID=1005048 RepID=G0AGX2_COLFT|nr:TonB-dependent siderophore receptor [Collimonas fungivorans]AEK61977.1 Ferrichrome-iron receptor [Collimonas fungivorans Ter331]